MTGTWLSRVAMSWLVYRMTGSVFLLGVTSFSSQILTLFLVPFAGVLADRSDQYKILFWTQFLLLLHSAVLAFLTLTHEIQFWHIIVLSLLQGAINAFDIPARQTFLVRMVERPSDLGNAIALNSSMFNGARLIGPAIAGGLIAWVGEGMCFFIDAVSYFAVLLSLVLMVVKPVPPKRGMAVLHELKEGFHYAFHFSPIRALIVMVAWISLMGMSYTVLLPVFAKDILLGGPGTLGLLTSAAGMGALIGALYLASRKSTVGLGRRIDYSAAFGGLGLVLFAISTHILISIFFIFVSAFGFMVLMASTNTVLQTIVDDDKRGRVMSFYTMAFLGMAPFGSLFSGWLASRMGAQDAMVLGGLACVFGAFLFAQKLPELNALVRPIYIRKGILPEVATGIDAASQD